MNNDHTQILVSAGISMSGDIMIECPVCRHRFEVLTTATDDTSVTCGNCGEVFYPIIDCVKDGKETFAPVTDFVKKNAKQWEKTRHRDQFKKGK